MLVYRTTGKHGKIVGSLFFAGYFLLFCSLGTVGSAQYLVYKANLAKSKWTETVAQTKGCSLGEYERGARFALHCGISYQFAGKTHTNSLDSNFIRSLRERSEISDWITRRRTETALVLKVNPAHPDQFIVQNHLPFKRGDDPAGFIRAAITMGSISLILLAAGRNLGRRGW
jgi:hypothetical protein